MDNDEGDVSGDDDDVFAEEEDEEDEGKDAVASEFELRMPLADAPDARRSKMIGAAVLCFCVDPQWGRIYFLLGKERHHVKWPQGSDRWAYFGGRPNVKAEPPETTAAREFIEETLGMVKYFSDDTIPRKSHEDIASSLQKGEYMFQITLWMKSASISKSYVTYVKQIPWDPYCVNRFAKARDTLVSIPRWINNPDKLNWLLLHPAVSRDADTHPHPPGDLEPGTAIRHRHRCNLVSSSSTATDTGDAGTKGTVDAPMQGCAVVVSKDFLEKSQIGLWSIPQLHHALQYKGILYSRNGRVERCHAPFMQFASLLLNELAFYDPDVYGGANNGNSWI